MKTIKKEYLIDAPVEKLWDALVNPKVIDKWGGGPAKMNDKTGSDFSLWGGDIHGTNTKVIENKLLEQDWFGGPWKEPSKLTFKLFPEGQNTKLVLTQSNVPPEEQNDIDSGWDDYYIGPLKTLLEQ